MTTMTRTTVMTTSKTTTTLPDERAVKKASIRLSWLLRHGAIESGLQMDSAGFAAVVDVLRLARLDVGTLATLVADNNKQRFEVRGGLSEGGARIRAVQGHSLEGTPVTLEGLESSWLVVDDDRPLFHGTSARAAGAILDSNGVHAAVAQVVDVVHLAAAVDATVGKRAAVDVLLKIDPQLLRAAGQRVFRAPNGVLLTRTVPRSAVIDVVAATRAGNEALARLREKLVK